MRDAPYLKRFEGIHLLLSIDVPSECATGCGCG
jgi:hypothetical protein